MQPYKVTDPERRQRIGIAASSLHQLVDIARRRLLSFAGNDRPAQLLLDDDGTLVDDPAYFALLPPQTCFMLCDVEKHQWKCADRSSLITSTVANNTRQDAPRFVKLATIERRQWLPIAVSSCTTVEHIKSVAADRFALAVESIVLDDDGCQVEDDDYLHELPHDSRLVALRRADEWTTAPECDADSVDARVAGADVSSLGMLVGESGVDVKAMLLLSDERLRMITSLSEEGLRSAFPLGSDRIAHALALQELAADALERREEERNRFDLIQWYRRHLSNDDSESQQVD